MNLWGESPLYENRKVFIVMDTNKSTSRRQGRLREEGSEGSPMANVRDDEQKPHIRLSLLGELAQHERSPQVQGTG